MKKVLLVYPDLHAVAPSFPHSLLPLAAVLEEKEIEVEIFDGQIENYRNISNKDFDIVGISSLTGYQIKSGLEIARFIREHDRSIPIIWGGVHPSILPEQTVRSEYVDIVVRGEGEETLVELVDVLRNSKDLKTVKGITYVEHGEIISTPDREFIDLNTLPLLPYYLLDAQKYSNVYRYPSVIYFHSSRGCPHNCGFCYIKQVHKNKWRAMSAERVLKEINHIVDYFKPSCIASSEDNFFCNRKRIEELCRLMIEKGPGINWSGSSHFGYVTNYDSGFLNLLCEAGCEGLSFGGESGSEKILKLINKRITPNDMKKMVQKLKEHGIKTGVNFMCGFPGETVEDLKLTFGLIDELTEINPSLIVAGITVYTPYPGSELLCVAIENGFNAPQSLEEWGNYVYSDVDNLPWLTGSHKSLVKTVNILSRFQLNKESYTSTGLFRNNPVKELLYRGFTILARKRWRHKFFYFPVEWMLLSKYMKYKNIAER